MSTSELTDRQLVNVEATNGRSRIVLIGATRVVARDVFTRLWRYPAAAGRRVSIITSSASQLFSRPKTPYAAAWLMPDCDQLAPHRLESFVELCRRYGYRVYDYTLHPGYDRDVDTYRTPPK